MFVLLLWVGLVALANDREELDEDLLLDLKVKSLLLCHIFEQEKALFELRVDQAANVISAELIAGLIIGHSWRDG